MDREWPARFGAKRLCAVCLGVLVILGLASCSSGGAGPNLSNAGTTSAAVTSSSASATGTPSGTASRSGTSAPVSAAPSTTASVPVSVPVDQIPPGNPARWVPAGVPTNAPYKEPGDVVPMFTREMFVNSQAGALATAKYYLDARNWAYATMSAVPFLLVCQSPGCRLDTPFYTFGAGHIVGGRRHVDSIVVEPSASPTALTVRAKVVVASGRLVDSNMKTVKSQAKSTQLTDLHFHCSSATASYDHPDAAESSTGLVVREMSCGPRQSAEAVNALPSDSECGAYMNWCTLRPGDKQDLSKETKVTTYTALDTGAPLRTDIDCDSAVGPPMPSAAEIKAEATKYAPHPRTASGGTQYLINAAVVFYATPPAGLTDLTKVSIPRFTLSGHTFDVRLTLTKAVWTWGDGTSATFDASDGHVLGTPYDESHPCESASSCHNYVAHTFTAPGTFTVTSAAHWSGTYALDGSAQQIPIPGDLFTADQAGRVVQVHEAHSVLVAPR
jgi:hypothetical protein